MKHALLAALLFLTTPALADTYKDVPYGRDDDQTFDVYTLENASNAPVILMVHGGAWRAGDKDNKQVVKNKVARWVSKGFVFITINYRMLPEADPLVQAEDVALALATAQKNAKRWGGDPSKFILMGHSAGAHLIALVTAKPYKGVQPWLGSVVLDSGALNVVTTMEGRHYRFHDRAFGKDPVYWKATSPTLQLKGRTVPTLLVCSTRREGPCPEAHEYAARANQLGGHAEVLEADLSHRDINETLGLENAYTVKVEAFMKGLHPTVAEKMD